MSGDDRDGAGDGGDDRDGAGDGGDDRDGADNSTDGRASGAAAAFELVGDPDRLSIVEVLIAAKRTDGDPHVRFTDLRDQSAIDDTGRFNYHLDKLLGTFVTKTDAGYRLSSYAHRVMAPMMGGVYDPDRASDAIDTPGECPDCGSDLRIQPDETVLQLVCEQGHTLNEGLLGYPGIVDDRSDDAVNETIGLLTAQGIELAVTGTCPTCHGPVEGAIGEADADGHRYFEAPCGTCGNQFATSVGACVLIHPTVVSFLYEHGIDVRTTVPWSLSFVYPGVETVESTDPLELTVGIQPESESLLVTVDRTATVVATDRHGP